MAERPVNSTCSAQVRQAHRCESHKDTAHQAEQPAPMERVLCGVFLGALLVVPAGLVRRSSGEQEQALGLEMIRQSLHPTCQSRCAQTEIDRDRQRQRERETDRDRGTETETGGGRQSAKSGVRRIATQPFKEAACQAWFMEEELVRKRAARRNATLVALAKLTRIWG